MPTRTATPTAHIWLDEQGRAWIDDRNVKVIEVAAEHVGQGLDAQQIWNDHSDWLTPAQIYAALAYYYDHKAELDSEMERQYQEYLRLRAESLDSPGRQKLRAMGKIP
jgi:uncharacterized protein (DUF433 family)